MRTIAYELQGKQVPASLVGRVITLQVPETLEEAQSLTENGTSDVVAKFADGDVIRRQGRLRGRAAKALKDAEGNVDKALAALQTWNDSAESKYSVRVEGAGAAAKPKTAQGRVTKAAASSGNKLFEKCLADEAFYNRMVKLQVVDETEFADWKAAREEAAAAKAATPATK